MKSERAWARDDESNWRMPRGTYTNLRGRRLINLSAGVKRQNTKAQTRDGTEQEEEEAGKNSTGNERSYRI